MGSKIELETLLLPFSPQMKWHQQGFKNWQDFSGSQASCEWNS
jgi:hypothetical protein